MKDKKQVAKISIFITSIFVIFLSVTYAFITTVITGEKNLVISAGTLDLVLEEENEITITDALPMYDDVGMIQEDVFNFRLVNKTSNPTKYVLKLTKVSTSNELNPSQVKYYLTKDGVGTPKLLSTLTNGKIDEGTIDGNTTIKYSLRLWIDSSVSNNSDISGKSLSYRIDVEVSQEIPNECILVENGKDTSNANVPVLTSGMIPVIYDECEKTWKKADISGKWYNYDTQNWANAVTVVENGTQTREYYKNAEAGEPININDINTMWVWIPRYEYQYTDLETSYAGGTKELPGEIKVNFIPAGQTSSSDSTKYKIPEGFKFGDENLSGFWMAKFETSTLETCSAKNYGVETGCDFITFTPQVRPNKKSWEGARVSTFFQASRLMQDANNASKYGFDIVGNGTMDVHMLKNTEWGIVAMLFQSKYGKYGNPAYSGANKEIYQNKSSSNLTGSSNGTPSQSTTNPEVTYDTPDTGYGASTTGTIYGVYDMSGGAHEYVMGSYDKRSGYTADKNSGFEGLDKDGNQITGLAWPNSKYYDNYTSSITSGYKAGDATHETKAWYNDDASFVGIYGPWFSRGGSDYTIYGTGAGAFNMSSKYGCSYIGVGFRLAIKP